MREGLFFIFLQYLIFCSISNTKAIIGINVRRANETEFISIASIISKKRKFNLVPDHLCSAVFVTKKHALTAKHCMCRNLKNCKVMVGSNISKSHEYKLNAWISYEQWAEKNNITPEYPENDISIITLENSVNIAYFEPAILSNKPSNKLYGKKVVTAGWGDTTDSTVSVFMQTVLLTVMSRRNCMQQINKCGNVNIYVPESLICTNANPFALIEAGESGGPLFDLDNNLVGINVATCPKTKHEFHPNEVNLHASIKYYRNFIDNIILSK